MPDDATSSDAVRDRTGASRVATWLLLSASRWRVAAVLFLALFFAFVGLGAVDPFGLPQIAGEKDPVETLGQAFVTAIVTGVTLVVTINQVVLSQELGAVGDQRERMQGSTQFRADVAEVLEVPVAPADPSAFLRALVEAAGERGAALRDAVAGGTAGPVAAYADGLTADAAAVSDRLAGAQFGTFGALSAALDFDYSRKLYEAERLRAEHEDALPEGALTALEDVAKVLRLFGPAREHVKTLYFQWELINLSRGMLYAAAPAIVVSTGMVLVLDDAETVTGTTLGVADHLWLVAAASALALLPFVVLGAYVLRIATVAKRTLAIGPFVLQETDRRETVDGPD